MRRPLTLLLVIAAVLVLGAGGAVAGGGGGAICQGFGSGQEVVMLDSCFEGTGHVVTAGQTVTVRNGGRLPHTITATDGTFDSGTIQPGETFELTVEDAGPLPVYCTLHGSPDGAGMAGLLAVQPADLASAEPAAASVPGGPLLPWLGAAAVLLVGAGAVLARRRVSPATAPGGAGRRRAAPSGPAGSPRTPDAGAG